ncbi:MAG TPA: DUF4383 domain-containing protein [Candidatus Angelobacter sp.]|jgi:hypothetical protein|nr:DUF4383 domain-containing protein [Candidatus Angelobacter sp.]
MSIGNRATVQTVALAFGGIYLLAGILGFLTFFGGSYTLTSKPLFNLFQVNLVHNLVHVVIGVAGLAAASSARNSRTFCQVLAVVLFLLGILGIFVARPFGLIDIGGADVALHIVSGAVLAYFGFQAPIAARAR